MKTTRLLALVPVAALAVGLTACSPSHAHHATPAESAQAKSDAKAIAAKCLPSSSLAQLQLIKSLEKPAGRSALETKCGIPPARKQVFESQVLSAAEKGKLTTSAGRQTFFAVTLPKLVEENQA